jgi:two-component system response regulator
MPITRETLRIVLIENDSDDAFLLKRALKQGGFLYPLTHFQDGAEAIDYFKALETPTSRLPDIILTDLKMPRIDGMDFLRWLRDHPLLKDLPVIVLTSSNQLSDKSRTGRMGVFKFLTKQIHYENVISTLELFLLSLNKDSGSPGV